MHILFQMVDAAKLNAYKIFSRVNREWAADHPMHKQGRSDFDWQLMNELAEECMAWRVSDSNTECIKPKGLKALGFYGFHRREQSRQGLQREQPRQEVEGEKKIRKPCFICTARKYAPRNLRNCRECQGTCCTNHTAITTPISYVCTTCAGVEVPDLSLILEEKKKTTETAKIRQVSFLICFLMMI
jgi:hypothetical protein